MTQPGTASVPRTLRPDAQGRAIVYFDGGSRPNPGSMHAAVVSQGRAWFRDDLGHGDNNEAEWLALLYALDVARGQELTNLLLIGDSALVIAQASGRQRCRSAHLRPYHVRFQDASAQFRRIQLRHVSRHKNLAGIALTRRDLP